MAGPSRRLRGIAKLGGICLLLIAAGASFPRAGHGGEPSDAGGTNHGRLTRLSLRIAQAEGNKSRITKYKSLARQQRARKNPALPFSPPGTRASRPGRLP